MTVNTEHMLTLFGCLSPDGSLMRATFEEAHDLAIQGLHVGQIYEIWQLNHDRLCRRFAKSNLLGSDIGYFLHRARVTLEEGKHEAKFASLCVQEAADALYGTPDQLYGDFDPTDHEDTWNFKDHHNAKQTKPLINAGVADLISDVIDKMVDEIPPRVPAINEVVLTHELVA